MYHNHNPINILRCRYYISWGIATMWSTQCHQLPLMVRTPVRVMCFPSSKAKDIFESSQRHQASLQLFAAMDAASDDEPEGKAAGKVYQAWCIDIDIHLYIYTWIESTGYEVLHMLHLNKHSVDFCNVNLYFGMRL